MRILIAAVVSAVLMFLWGFVFWGLLGISERIQYAVADEAAAQQSLRAIFPETGAYFIPYPDSENPDAAELHRAGPIAQVFVRVEGAEVMAPAMMAMGFVHFLIAALLMAVLLDWVSPALLTYSKRFTFVVFAGVVGSFLAKFSPPIWFYHPWLYHTADFIYLLFAWAAAGVVLAALIRPPKPEPVTSD